MARAALNWGLRDLEKRTGISKNTLARFEAGKGVLLSTAQTIQDAFALEGITFLLEDTDHGPGIVLAKSSPSPLNSSKPKKRSTKTK